MPNTPALGFPYPASTDLVADGYQNIEQLAEAVEDTLLGANYVGRYRNLLYNGDMRIAQRTISATGVTVPGYYNLDRWAISAGNLGTWTLQQATDAGLRPFGLSSYQYIRNTTADTSPAAGDFFLYEQKLEGQDLQHLRKGTAEARSLTLSFYVYTNKTGTYIASLFDNDNSRLVSLPYTVSTANTWTRIELTFPPDTTGTLDNDNSASLILQFWLAAGSNFTSGTLQTTWGARVDANRAVGVVNLADSTANYWSVTGVQLEAGDKATPFEHKPYGEELARCQRYFFKTYQQGVNPGAITNSGCFLIETNDYNGIHSATVPFPVSMRVNPTITGYSRASGAAGFWRVFNQSRGLNIDAAVSFASPGPNSTNVTITFNGSLMTGHLVAEAEL